MPEILPPYQINTPEHVPGTAISIQPPTAQHANWLEDYEYYDQLGRDPLQVRRIWGIPDPKVRVEKLKEVLEEFPKQMHRRQILLTAASRGDEEIVRCIVETGLKVHPDIEKALKQDEQESDEDNIDGASLPDKEDSSCAPVHSAAIAGHVGVLKIFLESGIEVDLRDEFGRTLLLAAANGHKLEAMEYLLAQGADPTARANGSDLSKEWLGDYAAADALELMALHKSIDMMKLLLKKPGVKVTPLAIQSPGAGPHHYEAMRLLLEQGGCLMEGQDDLIVNESNEDLRQAAMDAIPVVVQVGELDSLKLFLGFKYPMIKNNDIHSFEVPTELHKNFVYGAYTAVKYDQPDKFEFIYSLGIKEHDQMSLDDLPSGQHLNIQHLLDEAVQAGSMKCIRLLIEKYGANPHKCRIPSGVLPLFQAAGNDKPEVVRYLLDEQNVDIQMGSGRFSAGPTALWVAIFLKSMESVALLLQHGGPLNHIDDEIQTMGNGPLDTVLIAHKDGTVSFETEANAQKFIDRERNAYEFPNSHYVRIVLKDEDKSWIEKLQLRKPDEELRDEGRELNAKESIKYEDLEEGDVRKICPEFPSFDDRANELKKEEDLIPPFEAAFVAKPVTGKRKR